MSEQEESTFVVAHVGTEWQATLVSDILRDHGVDAEVSGALTSQFRAEAPGLVRILVPESQVEKARAVLEEPRKEVSEIDWSQVDVGTPE
ncbi:MAG: putative signal transducing protein [Planctomycetota bacterium]|jgi:ATP phosphoribosyltransferase regulatory subunit HisZ